MSEKHTAARSVMAVILFCLAVSLLGCMASCTSLADIPTSLSSSFGEQAGTWIGQAEKRGLFSGFVVVGTKDGIVWQQGFGTDGLGGKPRADHVYSIGSVTKVITGMAVLDAADRGLLALDDPLDRWFPDFPGGGDIRLSQLLEHSSGLPEISKKPFFWFRLGRQVAFEEHYHYISTARRMFAPGTEFSYCNSGYILLGRILELASGLSYGEYVRSRIAVPLGLHTLEIDDGGIRPDRLRGFLQVKPFAVRGLREHPSQPMAAGSALCRPLDLYRLGVDTIGNGNSPLQRIGMARKEAWKGMSYGYGIFSGTIKVDGKERRILWHSGGHGGFASMFAVYPDDGLVIVVLANIRNPAHWFIGEEIEAGLAKLYFRQ